MDFEQLQLFRKLAETEHMSNTAAEFHLSQSTLSNSLQRLENDLGCRLFTRKGRRIYLNEAGKAFLPYANRLLQELNEAQIALGEMTQQQNNLVHISAPPYTSFPDLFTGLTATYPEISLENDSYMPSEIKSQLLSGQLDFCVTGLHLDEEDLEKIVLSNDELVIVMSCDHPLARQNSAPLRAFSGERFCDYARHDPAGSNLQRYCRVAGFHVQESFYVHTISDVFSVVETTNVLALVPLRIFDVYAKSRPAIKAVHLSDPPCYSHLYLYRKKNSRERVSVRKARNYFVSYFSQ